MRNHVIQICAFVLFLWPASLQGQSPSAEKPKAENLDKWLTFIRPSAEELAFERIGWRNKFWPAVEEARKLGRPILLWTMNGHPLACT